MNRQMPKIDLDALQDDLEPKDFAIVRRIVATKGKNKGRLRASKPKVQNEVDPLSGKAAYVWRMVCFMASPNPQHSCMPVTADWDLPIYDEDESWLADASEGAKRRREMCKELDALVDKVAATLPISEGAASWMRGFGMIG